MPSRAHGLDEPAWNENCPPHGKHLVGPFLEEPDKPFRSCLDLSDGIAIGTVTVHDNVDVGEANSRVPALRFAPGLCFDRVDTAVAENDMIDIEAIRRNVVENVRTGRSELVELLGNDSLTIPPELQSAKSSANSYALPSGVDRGGHR